MKQYSFLKKAICDLSEISKDFTHESSMLSALSRLENRNIIRKLKRGLYALVNPLTEDIYVNKFEIGTILHDGNYIAYHSALEYYGLATQVYYDVHVISKSHYSSINIEGLEYQFYQSDYDEGIIETNHSSLIRITTLERTIIDCINKEKIAGGLEEVFMALNMITYLDENKLLYHLKKYNSKLLYKKVGYLFSLIKPDYLSNNFYNICKSNISSRIDDLRENKKVAYIYDKEWKLYIAKDLMNMEN